MTGTAERLGFIGLGVMGGPMSRNLLERSRRPLVVFDIDERRSDALAAGGATVAADVAGVGTGADTVFLSLPAAEHVESVVLGPGGLLEHGRPGQIVIDMSTAPVELERRCADELAAAGMVFVDAPVARTRQAAIDGTLAVMVGCADRATFEALSPLFACMATDVSYCGPPGSGAIVKLLNNMIVFETVVALSEAVTVARRAGVDPTTVFDVLATGSAASFALANHGRRALLPDEHPTDAFSSRYMAKDLSYVLSFARSLGLTLPEASLAHDLLEQSIAAGNGDAYHTAVVRVIEALGPEA